MNELEGKSEDDKSVGRKTFCTYFLQVLQDTSYLKISDEEAADLYEEIAQQDSFDGGTERLTPEKFYTSSLSRFLSDAQIHELMKVR